MKTSTLFKILFFITFLAAVVQIGEAGAVGTPNVPMKDQMVHPDSFTDMLIQICKEKRPNDWERCVESFKRLENIGKFRSKKRKKCGYLIIEEMPRYRPCL